MDSWKMWLIFIIIGLVVFVVLSIILHKINRHFLRKYNTSPYGGAVLMLVAAGTIAGGFFLLNSSKMLGLALVGVGILAILITLIYDFKKFGIKGFFVLLLQLVFCVPSIIVILDVIFNRGRSTIFSTAYIASDMRDDRRAARRNKNDDYRY